MFEKCPDIDIIIIKKILPHKLFIKAGRIFYVWK